jgi:hypothetical protein
MCSNTKISAYIYPKKERANENENSSTPNPLTRDFRSAHDVLSGHFTQLPPLSWAPPAPFLFLSFHLHCPPLPRPPAGRSSSLPPPGKGSKHNGYRCFFFSRCPRLPITAQILCVLRILASQYTVSTNFPRPQGKISRIDLLPSCSCEPLLPSLPLLPTYVQRKKKDNDNN